MRTGAMLPESRVKKTTPRSLSIKGSGSLKLLTADEDATEPDQECRLAIAAARRDMRRRRRRERNARRKGERENRLEDDGTAELTKKKRKRRMKAKKRLQQQGEQVAEQAVMTREQFETDECFENRKDESKQQKKERPRTLKEEHARWWLLEIHRQEDAA
jgi:hypothetical protein